MLQDSALCKSIAGIQRHETFFERSPANSLTGYFREAEANSLHLFYDAPPPFLLDDSTSKANICRATSKAAGTHLEIEL
jgi:hypothetical protein